MFQNVWVPSFLSYLYLGIIFNVNKQTKKPTIADLGDTEIVSYNLQLSSFSCCTTLRDLWTLLTGSLWLVYWNVQIQDLGLTWTGLSENICLGGKKIWLLFLFLYLCLIFFFGIGRTSGMNKSVRPAVCCCGDSNIR